MILLYKKSIIANCNDISLHVVRRHKTILLLQPRSKQQYLTTIGKEAFWFFFMSSRQ